MTLNNSTTNGLEVSSVESLAALEADHEFLLKGDVFTPLLIERWISYKREKEIQPLRMRPHPLEYALYFDIRRKKGKRVKGRTAVIPLPSSPVPSE